MAEREQKRRPAPAREEADVEVYRGDPHRVAPIYDTEAS